MTIQVQAAEQIDKFWNLIELQAKAIRLKLKFPHCTETDMKNEHFSAVCSFQAQLEEQGGDPQKIENGSVE